ncbi:hypothetical protein [Polaribacter sp. Asnod6-C07]|uniref:hypothetical protein n=1 Tax=Polaribacter sp. Asnod6-C07 TaxID=3160582 RepID=UPI0038683984
MNWKFEEESVLKNYSESTPCKEIFQAVCDEIGKYFTEKGWKYSRSRPKITFKNKDLKIDIAFWSSGSNTPGNFVNLEILPQIYSLELLNKLKSEGIKSKGHILSFIDIFYERLETSEKGKKIILNAFGEKIERIDEYNRTSELIYNNSINVYGLNEIEFLKIIEFIERKIIVWFKRINNIEQIDLFLKKLAERNKTRLKGGDFEKLIELKYPDYKIEKTTANTV